MANLTDDPTRLAFSTDGDMLAIGFRDGRLLILDTDTGEALAAFAAHEGLIRRVLFDPNRGEFITCRGSDPLRWWSHKKTDGPTQELSPFGDEGWTQDVATDSFGGRIAAIGEDAIATYDLPSLAPIKTATIDETMGSNNCACFAGDVLFIGRQSGYFYAYDHDLEVVADGGVYSRAISAVGGHPEGAVFVAGGSKGSMVVISTNVIHEHGATGDDDTWRNIKVFRGEPPKPIAVNSVTFNRDGSEFVAACSDGALRRVDWAEKGFARELGTPFYLRDPKPAWDISMAITDGAFSPTGNYVVSAHCNGTVQFWRNGEWMGDPLMTGKFVKGKWSVDADWKETAEKLATRK